MSKKDNSEKRLEKERAVKNSYLTVTEHDFFSAAFRILVQSDEEVSAQKLRSCANSIFINWRDQMIEVWANCVGSTRWPVRFMTLYPRLLDLCWGVDEHYAANMASCGEPDESNVAINAGYLIAVLRWYNLERNGRVPELSTVDSDAWLQANGFHTVGKNPLQPSLFSVAIG